MCVHGRPQLATLCEQLARTRPERTGPHLPGAALESREAVLVQGPRAASSAWAAVDPEELSALELESTLAVPILARGKALGAIGLVSGAARVYAPADVRLAEQVAEHTALSIENARLYRAARQAIATRDEVLGIVAHDLRNPLGAILMQVELLEHLIGGPVPDGSERRAAQTIQRAALRMNRLIQDLLEVTRIESGNLGIERTAASASELVHDAVDAQLPLASHASLELRLELRSELPELWVDAERLQQVFENLIGNAIAATPAGGAITVSAEALPGEVLFSVADTGQGVAPEDLPHLFDRFWQARRNRRQGTGLGLAIVKGLVEAHGGRVWVESKLDHGTTFFFTVPVASGAERKDSQ